MYEISKSANPKGSRLPDIVPIGDLEDQILIWAMRITHWLNQEMLLKPQSMQDDIDPRTKAAGLAILRLTDPATKGSDELLRAIIERRQHKVKLPA